MTKTEFLQEMETLKINYGKEQYPELAKLDIYYKILKRFEARDLRIAILRLIANRTFKDFPSVAEIVSYITKTTEKDLDIAINYARESLKKTIIQVGSYKSVKFEDEGIHAVIDSLGGWTKLCEMNMDDFNKFLTFEFPKIYKAYKLMPYKVSQVCIGRNEDTTNVRFVGYNTMEIKAIETSKVKTEATKGIDYSNLKKKMLLGG